MTINFRRNALQLRAAALFSSALWLTPLTCRRFKVTVTDKQCEPMTITVNAGKTQFIVQNHRPEGAGVGDPQRRDGGGRAGKYRPWF